MGVFTHSHVFLTRTRSHTCCIRCAYVLPSGHARCLHFHISVYVFPGFLHIDGLSLQLRDLFFQWRAASPRMLLEFPRLGTSSLTISACAPRHHAQERRTFPILRLAGLHVAPISVDMHPLSLIFVCSRAQGAPPQPAFLTARRVTAPIA